MKLLQSAHDRLSDAITFLQEERAQQPPIICQILLQMEQRLRLDQAHLGVLIGLKSYATVRTKRPKERPASSKSPKRKRQ